jgi:hypothetical protein
MDRTGGCAPSAAGERTSNARSFALTDERIRGHRRHRTFRFRVIRATGDDVADRMPGLALRHGRERQRRYFRALASA